MGNPFVHVELMSTDVAKAEVGEGTGGGLMKNPMPNAESIGLPT
jgi:hypothetical protein